MITWRCDKCGHEATSKQIVGHEFKYCDHGFSTLAVPVGNVRDLCKSCMALVVKAERDYRRNENVGVWNAIKRALA